MPDDSIGQCRGLNVTCRPNAVVTLSLGLSGRNRTTADLRAVAQLAEIGRKRPGRPGVTRAGGLPFVHLPATGLIGQLDTAPIAWPGRRLPIRPNTV
jgi:hypothetical protein